MLDEYHTRHSPWRAWIAYDLTTFLYDLEHAVKWDRSRGHEWLLVYPLISLNRALNSNRVDRDPQKLRVKNNHLELVDETRSIYVRQTADIQREKTRSLYTHGLVSGGKREIHRYSLFSRTDCTPMDYLSSL